MIEPMNKDSFEKTGKVIARLENFGGGVTRRVFDLLIKENTRRAGDWTGDAAWAETEERPLKAKAVIYIVLAAFLTLLLWMAAARVDEVVTGSGKAIPTSGTQMVQAIDGGMVKEILVKESQAVSKDAVLVKINQTRFSSSLGERSAQLTALSAKAARLEAQTQGKPFAVPAEAADSMQNIIEHERRLYQTSLEEMRSAVKVARDQAFQRHQELVEANARLSQLTGACELAENELKATKQLLSSGAVSELEVIRLEKESARAKADRDQARAQITRTRGAIQEAEGQIKETELRYLNSWRNELTATLRELESLEEGNKALIDRVSQAEIRAPISGTIKRLFVNSKGSVIMPGGAVAEIVSDRDALVVEARLAPNDRAFARPGLPVVVKVTAYEYAVYGGLEGTVEHIGPDTMTDEKGSTYYTVRIRTKETDFGPDRPILPGMVAQVDIMTGKRTILAYLLRPLFRAKEKAFREH